MPFLIKQNWTRLNKTIWRSLEKRKSAPPDMYIELLRFARRRLSIQVNEAADSALSDPALAKEEFQRLPEPPSESKCIELFEGYYEVLQDFAKKGIAEHYKYEVRKFVEARNLRYGISDDCRFQLSIPGLLVSQYAVLRKVLTGTPHIEEALKQLETSVCRLRDLTYEERNCIGIATNVLEGIACSKTTNNQRTLGRAVDGCDMFPHRALRECVKNFYQFASNFTNIRHGSPGTRLRELKKDDALLAVAFAIAFGSYIYDNNSGSAILEGSL